MGDNPDFLLLRFVSLINFKNLVLESRQEIRETVVLKAHLKVNHEDNDIITNPGVLRACLAVLLIRDAPPETCVD